MHNTTSVKDWDIAVVGGGITGLVLALGLLKYDISFTIYEAATQFGEIGAGVGFEPCMVRAMELIDPRIRDAFLKCKPDANEHQSVWFRVRNGDGGSEAGNDGGRVFQGKMIGKGEVVTDLPARDGPKGGVSRAAFLDEIVKLIPMDKVRFNKRLDTITDDKDRSGCIVLHFTDGSCARHYTVIGCDGIKSAVRRKILTDAEATPTFSGKCAYRGLMPMEQAKDVMTFAELCVPQMYVGQDAHLLTFPIKDKTVLNVIAFVTRDNWRHGNDWVQSVGKEQIAEDFGHWDPVVRKLIAQLNNTDIWALFDHPPASTFFQKSPQICLVGDAAHASTPHQGAGAGMCIEDCKVLSDLLGKIQHQDEIPKAFSVFDQVRRPRALKLVKTSREAGELWEMQGPHGNDLDAFVRDAMERMNWIRDYDIEAEARLAKDMLA